MRTTRVWAGRRLATLGLGLGLAAGLAPGARAASMSSSTTTATTDPTSMAASTATAEATPSALIDYNTSGTVGLTGVSGPNVISFNSVTGAQFTAPSAFSLGEFLVAPLPPGVTTTYDNTPFSITYLAQAVNGVSLGTGATPVTITGELNGTVTGATQSNVVATFDPAPIGAFLTGNYLNIASVLGSTVSLVPSTTNGGATTAQAQISVTAAPIPEPTTIAVFLTAAVGYGFRRRFRASA